jgi:DNA helicase-2/ATP-dependent DNA helicase PcrA
MWKLAIENRQSAHWIDSMLANDENLQIIAHWLLWLSRESAVQPLPRILEYALGLNASEHLTSPLRRYYLECKTIDTPYLAGISAVHKLIGLAEEFCIQGQPTTADFLRLLHVNQENNRTITDQSLFVTAPNAVELLTVYKAKGLEFDNVYIIDAMESIWKPSTRGRKPPSNLPLRPAGDDYDDYVRLMFVAVTRAKRTISINTYYTNSLNEPALPSSIIRDILPARIITFENAGSSISVLEHVLSWPRLEGSVEKELLNNILERYTLSPSAFLDFLDVTKGGPHYFLEKYLLRLPEAQSVRAAFGNAMHSALEKTQQLIINNSFDIDQVLIAYEEALIKQELVNEEHQRYLEHGQKILMRLFNEYNLEILPSGRAEEKLSVSIGDTLFAGKLDRVDFNSATNTLLISDYKTGTPLSSFITHNSSIELKAWRHRTQLSLYAIMARESGRYKDADVTTQMIYVEAETKKELVRTFTPTKDDLEILSKLIGIVGNKITSLNLPDIRHYDTSFSGTKKFIEDLLSGSI